MPTDKFRIVAVDDDQDILHLIQLALHEEYEVVTIEDPSLALDLIDLCEPDVVIADIMMPKVTGYTIAEHMKKSSRHDTAVLVFLTAKDAPRDIKYGYKLGANLYLTKPFQPERLIRSLHVLLAESGGHPRRKTLSLRDIQLRQQLRLGLAPTPSPSRGTPEPPHGQPDSLNQAGAGSGSPEDDDDPPMRTTWVG